MNDSSSPRPSGFGALILTIAAMAGLTSLAGCFAGDDPTALAVAAAQGSGPVVKFDVFHKPFPDLPLPNDFATRYDGSSPTLRRLNASIAGGPTRWEQSTRAELDKLSGWGTLAPITVSFSTPIDPEVILARHYKDRQAFNDDAVLVINVTPGSPGFCEAVPLDLGQGNYPQVLADTHVYDADPRDGLQTVVFEEVEEDKNGNGVLDPGEDTDMDGILDHPNTRNGMVGSPLLEFYERQTNTLILKPVMPMREETTYAVVLTRRLTGADGQPVRSPFPGINHAAQTEALGRLPDCLGQYGMTTADVAFTWSFTTQSISHDYKLVRDGLHGLGPLAQVGADFPAQLGSLAEVRSPGPGVTNTHIVPVATFLPLAMQLLELTGSSKEQTAVFAATMRNVDYVVAGEFRSPQFFPRSSADQGGQLLPLYDQVWNLDAPPRAEAVPFWMFVPAHRKGPAPVALFIHGHGGSKFDAAAFAGVMASYGMATIGFEAPGHGVALPAGQQRLIASYFKMAGIAGLGDAVLHGRAIDWNNDEQLDSGADYWTSYVFHTRDNVRQTMVDVMQIVRTLRGFDGKTKWAFDPANTGAPGLAGDFDGDGAVDVGGAAPIHVIGGSLGGITGSVVAGVEPGVDDVVAIVPGGLLGEIGTRSTLGGVKNAMVLRALGPLFYAKSGRLMMRVNDAQTESLELTVSRLPALTPGDTAVLLNLKTGEYRCGAVQPSATFRVSVSVDAGDPLELRVYHGVLPPRAPEGCELPSGDSNGPYVDIKSFDSDVKYAGREYPSDSPLVAVTDGFGQRRATPDLRQFLGLAQIALEPADPMNWAPYWSGTRTMTYGTGETTHTNVLVMPSTGDPGVLVSGGIALARAAGFISYDKDDPRYGIPDNQVLIDHWAIEGTPRTGRYMNAMGQPVLMDVENLGAIVPVDDGYDVPRLDPPLHLIQQAKDGSWGGFLLVMLSPQGKHGFVGPDPSQKFDMGTYLLNIIGRYMASSGTQFSWDKCQVTSECPWPTAPLK